MKTWKRALSTNLSKKQLEILQPMLRVDQAGELGANYIYKGQLEVLKNTPLKPTIQHMWDQEKVHLEKMNEYLVATRTRPSVLYPLWQILGTVAGKTSAWMGKEYAMQLTESVETVIGNHYNDQIRELIAMNDPANDELIATLQKFRDEELEHKDIAKNDNKNLGLRVFDTLVQAGCKASIKIATVV
jgi:ubiquinone biosynthesis monooxygenase Coq7